MKESILGSLRFLIFSLIVFGGLYTVVVTGIGQLSFSDQANGSKVSVNNQVVGSKLIGQTFEQAKYSSGRSEEVSQLSSVSAKQKQLVEKRTVAELEKNPVERKVSNDLLTAPASGVNPDIGLATAYSQVARISRERGLPQQPACKLIDEHSQKGWFPDRFYVSALQLNLALNKLGI